MKMRLLAAVLAVAAVPFAAVAADTVENPYKSVKVGDTASYKMAMKFGPLAFDGTTTQTVTAKTDKEATVKTATKISGVESKDTEEKIDLTKPWDPTKSANLPAGAKATSKKLEDGEETVKAAGKEYKCKWETHQVTVEVMGQKMDMKMKVWQSKDFVLNMVKMEMTGDLSGQKMEMKLDLEDSGTKKTEDGKKE